MHFNPRAPCGARPIPKSVKQVSSLISTHAPLAGRDLRPFMGIFCNIYFNPRAPCGARPDRTFNVAHFAGISTHAPLAGRDRGVVFIGDREFDISTHAPLAGRDTTEAAVKSVVCISTHAPLAGRDYSLLGEGCKYVISTHAPLAGRDHCVAVQRIFANKFQPTRPLRGATVSNATVRATRRHFNPRAPCGARPLAYGGLHRKQRISTHAPLAGRDTMAFARFGGLCISTHAPLAGRDNSEDFFIMTDFISTHAPLAGRD